MAKGEPQQQGASSLRFVVAGLVVATVGIFVGVQYSGKNAQEIMVAIQDKLKDFGVPLGQVHNEEVEKKHYEQQHEKPGNVDEREQMRQKQLREHQERKRQQQELEKKRQQEEEERRRRYAEELEKLKKERERAEQEPTAETATTTAAATKKMRFEPECYTSA
ncbi:unnamed protein product [Cylicocyclus nassatus]|uniref:Uncharacterized protein n=1 Tax=Cylicocyclus nassatus TaxID=53992 RepID=A0AA36MGY2_CYLNA|nr:unnamed protein product [Cylicocyclus nassatus]